MAVSKKVRALETRRSSAKSAPAQNSTRLCPYFSAGNGALINVAARRRHLSCFRRCGGALLASLLVHVDDGRERARPSSFLFNATTSIDGASLAPFSVPCGLVLHYPIDCIEFRPFAFARLQLLEAYL